MERYGAVLNIAMPIFVGLFLLEKIIEWRRGAQVIRSMDSVSSFSSGITNVVKDVLGLSIGIISYSWMYKHLALVHFEASWLLYLLAFMAMDFHGYWSHRWSHEINLFWNLHIIHHSSEEFNLSCALRQSISNVISFFTFLLLPAALLGVPPEVVATVGPLHLFLQFWYHTRLIDRMGWLEHIIVTPSHHRVHHAINKEYLDKNYGQIFIFWDKWFGTFQEEQKEAPPVYGVKRPVSTWNPVKINFQHLWLMMQDAWRTRNWWDKLRVWFMPTGWRPADVQDKYPVFSVGDVQEQVKYAPAASTGLKVWAWVQMFFNYGLLTFFFAFIARIGSPGIFWYGAYFFIAIYAYTELMDRNRNAVWMELLKSGYALFFVWQNGWFGAAELAGDWLLWFIVGYQVVSVFVTAYFTVKEFGQEEPMRLAGA